MKRTLLLTSAAVALTLGLTPALAQDQDHTNSKMKRDPAATEQHDRDANRQSQKAKPERGAKEAAPASDTTSSRNAANKDEAGSRNTTGQADDEKAGTKPSDTNTANSKSATPKSADTDSKSGESKRAEDRSQKPSGAAATNKSGTSEPSKNAEQNGSRSPAAQKSTQTNEPNRNAASQAPSRDAAEKSGSAPQERAAAKLDPQKKSQLTAAIDKVNVKPLTHVGFSVSVGVAVPRTVELRPVPTTIVDIVPQYRGYDFFVVRDEVVIVEPRTHKIVDVIERGPSRARAETTTRHLKLSKHQREIIRRHATTRRKATTGAGSRTTTEVTVGETLPESVEVESFPEEVYREVPEVREYRYIERGDDLYLVDPSSRRVIEEVR